jgi:hypothetical protein
MQHEESQILTKCLLKIEAQLQWGSADQWHSNVFDELSELISSQTGVLLSPTTLKRVWGKVNYDHAPSISTLNTLAIFAGFSNWRDFKNKIDLVSLPPTVKSRYSNQKIIITSAAALTLVFISLFSMIGLRPTPPVKDYSNVVFKSKAIAKGYPNTVVFDIDIDSINSDSIHIQQYWDPSKTIQLKKGQKQATGIYYYPGHFRAKLVVDGTIVKQHDLFLKSQGWTSTIDYAPVPKYHNLSKQDLNATLRFSDAFQTEVRQLIEPMYSTFHYVNDLGIADGDNFKMETSIRSTYFDKWAVCQTTYLYLLGTKGAIIIPFSKLGCVSDLDLMLNGPSISGKEHDLSAFGVDFTVFQQIGVDVKDKHVTVSIGGEKIYADQYLSSMGELVGLRYKFMGLGEVADLTISNN